MTFLRFIFIACFLIFQLVFLTTKAEKEDLWIKTSDKMCYIGNSITANGNYSFFIDLYHHTRYPNLKFTSYNCGISGNTAQDVLNRMDEDILIHKPTIATIKLGMNDVNIGLYHIGKLSEDTLALRKAAIETYRKNLTQIADQLIASGCQLLFLTPTIYDQTAKITAKNNFGVNDALASCANIVRETAVKYNALIVDFYTVLKRINLEQQTKDSTFTLIGPDRVHPGLVGNVVMAYTFLKSMHSDSIVSEIEIDTSTKILLKSTNCKINKLNVTSKGIYFQAKEFSLPFPVMECAKEALDLVPFQQNLNRETFKISNLAQGEYWFIIDEDTIGKFSDSQLSTGLNLADFKHTPQYKQALHVMDISWKKHLLVSQKLRNIALVDFTVLKDKNFSTMTEIQHFLNAELEEINEKPYYPWLKTKYNEYLKLKPEETSLQKKVEQLNKKIYKYNKPKKHRYKIQQI
jgi:lysophospholipase L1-like esterase